MACADIAAVLLAAGAGTRFGRNKLEADLGGAMLGVHAARTVATMGFGRTFAVHDPAHAGLAAELDALGFALIDNAAPELGLSHSLALATKAAGETGAAAMLVLLADMPFVTAAHLAALIAAWRAQPDRVTTSTADGVRMPPAIFPRGVWPALRVLSGDQGARSLLRDAATVTGDVAQFADIDTPGNLAAARAFRIGVPLRDSL